MASVSSLDQDMRRLRMERVTPQAEEEVRTFIRESLKTTEERNPAQEQKSAKNREIDDKLLARISKERLFEFLGDGVALCRLAERAGAGPLKYTYNATQPFHVRENIEKFILCCKESPINLHAHDLFVTADLFESKDLAQVIQCLGAFSRTAHRLKPASFPNQIGGRSGGGVVSPQGTGTPRASWTGRPRGESNTSNSSSTYTHARPSSSLAPSRTGDTPNSGRWSPTKSTSGSNWSKGAEKGVTPPPWSEFQYGSLRGANQGSLGVSFGAPRQITSASPLVPSLAEKEKARKQKQEEEERLRREEQKAEEERIRAEEERARAEEDRKWAEETARVRERERVKLEEEKRKWEEEDRRWNLEDKRREQEEKEAEARLEEERRRVRGKSDVRLQGQFLSQYQAESSASQDPDNRIKHLERELELAREREREYELERQSRSSVRSGRPVEDRDRSARRQAESAKARSRSRSRPRAPSRKASEDNWKQRDERDYLQQEWSTHNREQDAPQPSKSPRPLPDPTHPVRVKTNHTGPSSRPLPDPANYVSPKEPPRTFQSDQNRPGQYASPDADTQSFQPRTTYSKELGAFDSVGERDAEEQRRLASQSKPFAKPRSQMTIVERAMETERLRQQEWEANLQENQKKMLSTPSRGLVGPRPPPR